MDNKMSFEEALEAALMTEIRMELVAHDMTQQTLAEKLETTKATLNKYLKGHRSMPLGFLSRVAQILGVSVHELMERAETRASKQL